MLWTMNRWIIKRRQSAIVPIRRARAQTEMCSTSSSSLQMSNIYHSISLRFRFRQSARLLFDETGCAPHKTSAERCVMIQFHILPLSRLVDAFYLPIISFMIHKLNSRDFIASFSASMEGFSFSKLKSAASNMLLASLPPYPLSRVKGEVDFVNLLSATLPLSLSRLRPNPRNLFCECLSPY